MTHVLIDGALLLHDQLKRAGLEGIATIGLDDERQIAIVWSPSERSRYHVMQTVVESILRPRPDLAAALMLIHERKAHLDRLRATYDIDADLLAHVVGDVVAYVREDMRTLTRSSRERPPWLLTYLHDAPDMRCARHVVWPEERERIARLLDRRAQPPPYRPAAERTLLAQLAQAPEHGDMIDVIETPPPSVAFFDEGLPTEGDYRIEKRTFRRVPYRRGDDVFVAFREV